MTTNHRDPGLDTLFDLDGQTLFVDEVGHWVKFVVRRTTVTPERPHGLSYSLTLHAPDSDRLVGFDNAHPVKERRGPGTRRHVGKVTIGIGCGQSGPMSTRTRPRFLRISGKKSMKFCRKGD